MNTSFLSGTVAFRASARAWAYSSPVNVFPFVRVFSGSLTKAPFVGYSAMDVDIRALRSAAQGCAARVSRMQAQRQRTNQFQMRNSQDLLRNASVEVSSGLTKSNEFSFRDLHLR